MVAAITTGIFVAGYFGALSLEHIYNSSGGFAVWALSLTVFLATRSGLKARGVRVRRRRAVVIR